MSSMYFPPRFNDCVCSCHSVPGIWHLTACCISTKEMPFICKEIPMQESKRFTQEQFDQVLAGTIGQIKNLALLKGGEYSGDFDRLLNFRRNGEAMGLDYRQIWGVYAAKHWDAIMQSIKDLSTGKDRQRLESLSGRADDLIVYLILFKCMLQEQENAGTSETTSAEEKAN